VSVFQSNIKPSAGEVLEFTAIAQVKFLENPNDYTDVTVIPVTIPFSATVSPQRVWEGSQTVEVNGYALTLTAVRHDARVTEFDLCLPFLPTANGSGDILRPYLTQTTTPIIPIRETLLRAPSDSTVVSPEATAEPRIAADTSNADTVCSTLMVYEQAQDDDGTLRLTIDELRSSGSPTRENTPLIIAAMQAAGMTGTVQWDDANGFGMSGPDNLSSPVATRDWQRQLWHIISTISSERILGPWVFEVRLA
jgi:hypothetical protein